MTLYICRLFLTSANSRTMAQDGCLISDIPECLAGSRQTPKHRTMCLKWRHRRSKQIKAGPGRASNIDSILTNSISHTVYLLNYMTSKACDELSEPKPPFHNNINKSDDLRCFCKWPKWTSKSVLSPLSKRLGAALDLLMRYS